MSGQAHRRARRIAILAIEPVEELDVAGPMAAFAHANRLLGGNSLRYDVALAGTARGGSVCGESGLRLAGVADYRNVTGEIDTLIVAGGNGAIALRDPAFFEWVAERSLHARRVASICTGAFVLAGAGLLDGRRATTHWLEAATLAARFPDIDVDPEPIWIRDGKFRTSAGITAGIDLTLALIEEDHGAKLALDVARRLVMFTRRSGGQAQFSTFLSANAVATPALRELQMWIPQHLASNLSVAQLARRCAMSDRSFARAFAREFGTTPARYVETLRVESARHYLETTRRSTESVARTAGFGNAEGMRRAFIRLLKVTPWEYRHRLGYRY